MLMNFMYFKKSNPCQSILKFKVFDLGIYQFFYNLPFKLQLKIFKPLNKNQSQKIHTRENSS